MNIFDEVATPERREPNSKRPKKTIKQIMKEVSEHLLSWNQAFTLESNLL
jgi:hypothetical protein